MKKFVNFIQNFEKYFCAVLLVIMLAICAMQVIMSFMMLTMMFIMLPRAGVSARRIKQALVVVYDRRSYVLWQAACVLHKGCLQAEPGLLRDIHDFAELLYDLVFVGLGDDDALRIEYRQQDDGRGDDDPAGNAAL